MRKKIINFTANEFFFLVGFTTKKINWRLNLLEFLYFLRLELSSAQL